MKILIIGGTGAMGEPLTQIMSEDKENTVYVMVRHPRETEADNVIYLPGNANDFGFFTRTVSPGFDVIVDFMNWKPKKLKQRLEVIFTSCDQYIVMGSSAVYANSYGPLTEDSPRLIDHYSKAESKQTYRYHIRKSVIENLVMKAPHHHWTICRPSLTYNRNKVTILGYNKNIWLWRYLHDRTIVIPQDVMDKKTTITYGGDAARVISKLVGNPNALGEVVNVASDKTATQGEILDMYRELLPEIGGRELKIRFIPDASELWKDFPPQYDIYVKDRCLDRCFSTEKQTQMCGEKIEFGDTKEHLRQCLTALLAEPEALKPVADFNGWMDRIAGERTPLNVYPTREDKIKYLIFRHEFSCRLYRKWRYKRDKKVRYAYKAGL